MKLSIALAIICLTSCANIIKVGQPWPKTNLTYSFIGNIDSDRAIDRKMFRLAVSRINDNTVLTIAEYKGHSPNDADIKIKYEELPGNLGGWAYGYGSRFQGCISFQTNRKRVWSNAMILSISLHELGHSIGLRHSGHIASIMQVKISRKGAITNLSHWDVKNINELYKAD